MKKVKLALALFLAVTVALLGAVTVFAETIYYYFGFNYSIVNNSSVTVKGWDNSSPSVAIPETINNRYVISVDNHAFADNTYITDVSFDEATQLNRIGMFAFSGCTSLKSLNIPNQVTNIGMGAFQNCSSLESLVFDASISYVPEQCFYDCNSLSSVVLSDSVTAIKDFAFANCSSLEYIEIPASVKEIASTAFMNDNVKLGVYYNSDAYQYAMDNGLAYTVLDPENIPTEPPTETPTEAVTEAPTAAPTEAVTEPPTEIPTESAQTVTFLIGDADGNGEVNIIDSTIIQRVIAKIIDDSDGMISLRGDIDENGLSIDDATLLCRYLANIHLDYPVNTIVTRIIK